MTQETPVKVFSLLAVALTSMAFLLAITISNASFSEAQPLPDVFGPTNAMAVLDNVSNSYSNLLYANFINPAAEQYAFYGDNLAFIAQNAGPQILQLAGLQGLGQAPAAARAQVAGAFTQLPSVQVESPDHGGFSVDTLYSIFIR